jgi:hypothetical protein
MCWEALACRTSAYSITSSVRASNVGEISIPSALALLTLSLLRAYLTCVCESGFCPVVLGGADWTSGSSF